MRKLSACLLIAITLMVSACSQVKTEKQVTSDKTDSLVFIKGGEMIHTKSNFKGITLPDFYMGKYEVTQKEWTETMGSNPSAFREDQLPVEMVSWYDAIEYCNQRSIQEGFEPYYDIDKDKKDINNKSDNDSIKWTVTIREGANGYRLPTEAEWEYAAGGGQMSKNYTYSGSNNADEVAWYWQNAGDHYLTGEWNWAKIESNKTKTQPIGTKKPNELGLYDMSGNVREWCWDWYGEDDDIASGTFRVVKGGGWIGGVHTNEASFRGKFEANGIGPDQGFRVVRTITSP